VRLTIRDPEARRLARAVADATGETLTHAVTEALRERLDRLERRQAKASVEEILAIAKRASAHLMGHYRDHGDLLHDERGLPK
jgi:antitoxin VapB